MDTKGEMSAANKLQQSGDGTELGQNIGPGLTEREVPLPTAYDVKRIHRALDDFRDDDLKQIPILPVGSRLQQGATYLDLAADRPEEFKTTGAVTAAPGHYYVPKDRVPYEIWNRLIGEPKPGQ
ncbi:MAG TPA: hypothetical protein VGE02_12660 [Gemmatimonadales bacterium]